MCVCLPIFILSKQLHSQWHSISVAALLCGQLAEKYRPIMCRCVCSRSPFFSLLLQLEYSNNLHDFDDDYNRFDQCSWRNVQLHRRNDQRQQCLLLRERESAVISDNTAANFLLVGEV